MARIQRFARDFADHLGLSEATIQAAYSRAIGQAHHLAAYSQGPPSLGLKFTHKCK